DAGAAQITLCGADVLLREVGAVDDAPFADGAREEERRIAEARAELEDALRADRPRELEEVAADERSDDGEAALGPDALHLVPDRVAVVVEGLEICVHAGMGELHGSRSSRAGGGRVAIDLRAESISSRMR